MEEKLLQFQILFDEWQKEKINPRPNLNRFAILTDKILDFLKDIGFVNYLDDDFKLEIAKYFEF